MIQSDATAARISFNRFAADASASETVEKGRVLVVAHDFPPCRSIGATACAQIARYFPLYGWEPIVLTVREELLDQPDFRNRRPFPGVLVRTGVLPHPIRVYRKLKSKLSPPALSDDGLGNGGPARQDGIRQWILSLLLVPDDDTGWIPHATICGLNAIRRHNITHIFSSAPFFTNHLAAFVLATVTGLPWTVHLRDPWTQVDLEKPSTAVSRAIERWLERLVMSRADQIVCVTERHTRLIRRLFSKVPAEKFITIPNGYDEGEWQGIEPAAAAPGKFVIAFAGSLYDKRSPKPLFRAVRQLIDAGSIQAGEVQINLFGHCHTAEGRPVREMAEEAGLSECVHIEDFLSRSETLRRLAGSDLLLLLAEGLEYQIPGKTYEYLRAGRPILALTSEGAVADLLRRTDGAWIVDPGDEGGIVVAVRSAYLTWKRGASPRLPDSSVVAGFDRRILSGEIVRLFDSPQGRKNHEFKRASETSFQ